MIIGIPKEIIPGEQRTALIPSSVDRLVKKGATVLVEAGLGTSIGIPDEEYIKAGARIGLLGTVIGIMRAFGDISKAGTSGMSVVTVGIAEALICTAAGLLVAIPAVLSYNWFTRKIDNFVVDMELAASELVDLICVKKK